MKLKIEEKGCELWFENFVNGYPRFRGKILIDCKDRGDNFEYTIEYPILIKYTPYYGAKLYVGSWDLFFLNEEGRKKIGSSLVTENPDKWKIQIPLLWYGMGHHRIPQMCRELIFKMSNLLDNLIPFNYNIFSEIGREGKNWIRQIFLIFHRLFIYVGVRLPEEMILQILHFSQIPVSKKSN